VRFDGGVCVMGFELHLSMGFAVFWSDRVILYRCCCAVLLISSQR
jgi:hypothetical protein